MERFHVIPDAAVITLTKSVYRQAKVYQRGGALFMGQGNGFVRLYADGLTGVPDIRWDEIEIPGYPEPRADKLGKLSLSKPLKQIEAQ